MDFARLHGKLLDEEVARRRASKTAENAPGVKPLDPTDAPIALTPCV